MTTTVRIKVKRQPSAKGPVRWDVFEIPYHDNMNVISALMEVRKNPMTVGGKAVDPPLLGGRVP